MEEYCLLAGSLSSLSLLSYTGQEHLRKGGTTHNGLDPPAWIVN